MITHLACVMDGNRRWAKKQGLLPWNGHKAGTKSVQLVIEFCIKHNISYLSLYTFSLENFKRSDQERSYLFDLVVEHAQQHVAKFIEQGIAIQFSGELSLFPQAVQQVCHDVKKQTAGGTKLKINFLFGYGGQQEIVYAATECIKKIEKGAVMSQELFESCLWTSGIPNPDLVIRTGGVQRLSNFLLYQSAYAEIRFLDTLWPDITESDIFTTVMSAAQAQKNVGL
jgi:undecaprenyl diphosphate synthase